MTPLEDRWIIGITNKNDIVVSPFTNSYVKEWGDDLSRLHNTRRAGK